MVGFVFGFEKLLEGMTASVAEEGKGKGEVPLEETAVGKAEHFVFDFTRLLIQPFGEVVDPGAVEELRAEVGGCGVELDERLRRLHFE